MSQNSFDIRIDPLAFSAIKLKVFTDPSTHIAQTLLYNSGYVGPEIWPRGIDPLHLPFDFVLGQALNFAFTGTGVVRGADAIRNTPSQRGFYCGLIQTEVAQFSGWSADNLTPDGIAPFNCGVSILGSSTHISGDPSATGYLFCIDAVNSSNLFRLYKMNSGISTGTGGSIGSTYTQIYSSPSAAWSYNTWTTLTLFWFSDPYFLKGTWLMGWNTPNFNDPIVTDVLSTPNPLGWKQNLEGFDPFNYPDENHKVQPIFNIVHTGTGAIATNTSSGEGLYVANATNGAAVLFRNTKVYQFVVTSVNGVAYPPT